MPLWGNIDYVTQNNKPLFANTAIGSSNSSIHGTSANLTYGFVSGVSATEQAAATSKPQKPQHAGWVSVKVGTGPISNVSLSGVGSGINADGFIILSDSSTWSIATAANISYTKGNTQNTLQTYSTNPTMNGVVSLTINSGGNYSNVGAISYVISGANISTPTFTFTLGGRAGRMQTETLIAMGSITGDDSKDNVFFSGI